MVLLAIRSASPKVCGDGFAWKSWLEWAEGIRTNVFLYCYDDPSGRRRVEQVEAAVSRDPFALEGLIESLTIFERDPLFGTFAAESSGEIAALLAKAVP